MRSVSSDLHLGEQHESSSSEPCPKRLRSDETLGDKFSPDKVMIDRFTNFDVVLEWFTMYMLLIRGEKTVEEFSQRIFVVWRLVL